MAARLVDLLGGGTGTVRPGLQPLYDALIGHERPATVLRWLAKPHVSAALADLGAGRLQPDHAAFDALPAGKSTDHLRAMLVAVGVLPERDEHLARLERWITETISDHPEARRAATGTPSGTCCAGYATARTKPLTAGQATVVRRNLSAAIALLDWMSARDLTWPPPGQADLDQWLARPTADRIAAGHFARWARRQKLTGLGYPATGWDGPGGPIDTEARWEQARRLLHDQTLPTADRVAGLLVLLYAQQVSHPDQTHHHRRHNRQRPGASEAGPRPDRGARAAGRAGPVPGSQPAADTPPSPIRAPAPWLFPGGIPGRPLSASRLAERLRAIGVRAKQERSTALFTLAGELPAALLAQMLGIHISGAVKWQRASAGDWTTYAADYSRRGPSRQLSQGYSEPSDI